MWGANDSRPTEVVYFTIMIVFAQLLRKEAGRIDRNLARLVRRRADAARNRLEFVSRQRPDRGTEDLPAMFIAILRHKELLKLLANLNQHLRFNCGALYVNANTDMNQT